MPTPFRPAEVSTILKSLRDCQLPDDHAVRELRSNDRELAKFLDELHATREHLFQIERSVDAVLMPTHVFDMTNPHTVAEVVVHMLERQAKERLSDIRPFYGSGVYALYYHDGLSAYEAITRTECPIYVGSAGPKTPNATSPKAQGTKLYKRIKEHLKKSVSQSRNLTPEVFFCRYLVVQSGLEKAAEDFLIRRYLPVWNKESQVCSGIGKHGDRNRTELSSWDVMHGGRAWAEGQTSKSGKTPAIVEASIVTHFRRLLAEDRPRWERIFKREWVVAQPT